MFTSPAEFNMKTFILKKWSYHLYHSITVINKVETVLKESCGLITGCLKPTEHWQPIHPCWNCHTLEEQSQARKKNHNSYLILVILCSHTNSQQQDDYSLSKSFMGTVDPWATQSSVKAGGQYNTLIAHWTHRLCGAPISPTSVRPFDL